MAPVYGLNPFRPQKSFLRFVAGSAVPCKITAKKICNFERGNMDPITPVDPNLPETHRANSTQIDAHSALASAAEISPSAIAPSAISPPEPQEPFETRVLLKILLGPDGLRAGWSVLLFFILSSILSGIVFLVLIKTHLFDPKDRNFTPFNTSMGEFPQLLGLLVAGAIVALIERRRGNLLAFNLLGPHRVRHFIEGLIAGFVSLSALVGVMAWGGWLRFGPNALSGAQIFKFAALWGVACLLIGCVEEGQFRCYLQFTLTRGINFWWALGILGLVCLKLLIFNRGTSACWGVFILAGLGLIPCALLHFKKAESSGFWQAGWVTTTWFGLAHTGNNGENWIGIFAAGAIGFVFVVSIRVTGSAWWAIGCHAAWDWTETYFYGAIDSGNVATGHYLTVTPAGSTLWSGGADGPEGSLLVIAVFILMIVALVAIYGRSKPAQFPAPAADSAKG